MVVMTTGADENFQQLPEQTSLQKSVYNQLAP